MFSVHQIGPTLWEVRSSIPGSIIRAQFPTEAQARVHAAILNGNAQAQGTTTAGIPAPPPPPPPTASTTPPLPPPPVQLAQPVPPPPTATAPYVPLNAFTAATQAAQAMAAPMPLGGNQIAPRPAPYTPLGAFPIGMQYAAMPPVPQAQFPPMPPPTRVQQFGQAFRQAIPATAAFSGAPVANAARAAFAATVPEVAIPIAIAREFGDALKDSAKWMREFGEKISASNKSLGQYNGQLALAYARLNVGDFYRNVAVANRTAPSGDALVKAVDRMRDAWQETRVASGNIQNELGIFTARVSENLGNAFAPFSKALNDFVGKDKDGEGAKNFADMLTNGFEDVVDSIREWAGLEKLDRDKAPKPQLGPWDNLVIDIINGRVGGPILPGGILRQRAQIGGGGPVARFGRGI
jgi:hypothetical protein